MCVPIRTATSWWWEKQRASRPEHRDRSRVDTHREQYEPEHAETLQHPVVQRELLGCRTVATLETQLEVKPGPIAVSNVRGGRPAPIRRSSTKSAVGADMLP